MSVRVSVTVRVSLVWRHRHFLGDLGFGEMGHKERQRRLILFSRRNARSTPASKNVKATLSKQLTTLFAGVDRVSDVMSRRYPCKYWDPNDGGWRDVVWLSESVPTLSCCCMRSARCWRQCFTGYFAVCLHISQCVCVSVCVRIKTAKVHRLFRRTAFTDYHPDRFFWATRWFLFLVFQYFSFFVCRALD